MSKIPEETAGPYPGDGSNGPNALRTTGVVRSDIRSSFGGLSGSASGVLLNLELTIVSAASCSPLSDYAVYLWHCDAAGNYSLYSSGFTNQNFLRGVQAADANGKVKFTSIFPGCYSGRWPHIHFEVYQNLAAAQSVSNKIATSQIAHLEGRATWVYATSYARPALQSPGFARDRRGVFETARPSSWRRSQAMSQRNDRHAHRRSLEKGRSGPTSANAARAGDLQYRHPTPACCRDLAGGGRCRRKLHAIGAPRVREEPMSPTAARGAARSPIRHGVRLPHTRQLPSSCRRGRQRPFGLLLSASMISSLTDDLPPDLLCGPRPWSASGRYREFRAPTRRLGFRNQSS